MLFQKNSYLPFFMWLFPLSFFAYQFILRLWPGLMMPQIMAQFSIDASHFGLLAAFYYYGYALMQIPVAMLLDRFNARYIIFIFASMCGIATLLFTFSENFYLALITRFLIGAGSAVGFLGVSKVVSQWFLQKHYTRMIGFSFSIGLLGAIYGGKPVTLLIEAHSWQTMAVALAIFAIVIGVGALLVLRSPSTKDQDISQSQFKISDFKVLICSPVIWLLAIANLLMVGSLEGFADVWGVPYLMLAYSLDKGQAAGLISFVFFGMLFGGPLLAFLSKKFGHYPVIAFCGLGMASAFIFLLYSSVYHSILLSGLFFFIGILCCYQVLVFVAGSEIVPLQYMGITVAFLNCINMLGGSFFHTSIGKIMDIFWTGGLDKVGLKQYPLQDYQYALTIIPVSALIGTLLIYVVYRKVNKNSI